MNEARHSVEAVSGLVASLVGRSVVRVERDTYGVTNAVYVVGMDDGSERVLRVSSPGTGERLAAQVWAMAASRACGALVPRVLAHDTEGRTFPDPYLLMERVPGVPPPRARPDRDATRKVTVEMGRQLAKIHSVRVDGFGPLERSGGDYRGRYGTMWGAVEAELERWVAAIGSEALPPALRDEVRVCLGRVRERGLFELERPVLVHRDFQFRNVLVAEGRLSGIVDFDKVEAGDAARDFAVLYPGDVAVVREGYEEGRPGALGERFGERLRAYRLLGSLERLWHDEAAGRESAREQTHADIRRLVAALTSE